MCLAGEAGLRSGEVKALRWREDVDLIAKTITVNQQTCYSETTTPKGRTRRTIPMTATLEKALRALETIREGSSCGTWTAARRPMARRTRRSSESAGAPGYGRSAGIRLRHCFGTHAALFGVNPWRLQSWMGHKRIDETMIYDVAETHRREIPEAVLEGATRSATRTAVCSRCSAPAAQTWRKTKPAKTRVQRSSPVEIRGRTPDF
ncbi:MAG: tyrosine-type recombinase/integrase [Deltaproteobacteria bacterium]|nr:tyrosine-type recombinase/integrase [Deltaproteobacteria bacterium]